MTRHALDLIRMLAPATTGARRRAVVHLVPTLAWGGAERIACTVHRLALAAGLDSRIDAPSLPAIDAGIAAETGAALAPARAGEDTLRRWALAARARVRAARPALVHAHLPYPDRFAAALLASAGAPLVVTFQLLPDPARYWSPDELLAWRSDNVLSAFGPLVPRARFVAVSEADRARLARLLPPARVTLVRNVPPLPRAAPPHALAPSAPPPWPPGAVRLLSVGRLHAQKGFDRLVAALGHDSVRGLPWHWCIVGDGPERDTLAADLAARGLTARVSFLAERPATDVFPTADVVLSPSRFEGMPLVPMEAVEAGCAVLGSAISAHRELFGRVRGALVERADEPGAWAARLTELIGHPPARAALAAAERAALPPDPRRALWDAYAALYAPALTPQ